MTNHILVSLLLVLCLGLVTAQNSCGAGKYYNSTHCAPVPAGYYPTFNVDLQNESDLKKNWQAIKGNWDFSKFIACTGSVDYIYYSEDTGQTWTPFLTSGKLSWKGLSADRSFKQFAGAAYSHGIYISRDTGKSWKRAADAGLYTWYDVLGNSDFTKFIALPIYSYYVRLSVDSGTTWSNLVGSTTRTKYYLAASEDFTKMLYTTSNYMYRSLDDGMTWTAIGSNRNWRGVACNWDMSKIIGNVYYNYFYLSVNSGASWTTIKKTGTGYWMGMAASPDFTRFAVTSYNLKRLFISLDSAASFSSQGTTSSLKYAAAPAGQAIYKTSCPAGMYSSKGATTCTWCTKGRYAATGSSTCTICTDGMSAGIGMASCNNCPPGTSSNSTQLSCIPCVEGKYATSKSSGCTYVPNGKYPSKTLDLTTHPVSITQPGLKKTWRAVTASWDFSELCATVYNDYIYKSVDGGQTWNPMVKSGKLNWYGITSSANFTSYAAVAYSHGVYASWDSGATWKSLASAGVYTWYDVIGNEDLSKMIVLPIYSYYLKLSGDRGVTWQNLVGSTTRTKYFLAVSKDMGKILYTTSNYMYRSLDNGLTYCYWF